MKRFVNFGNLSKLSRQVSTVMSCLKIDEIWDHYDFFTVKTESD